MEIFDEIKINPELVVFPWAGIDDKVYSVQLKVRFILSGIFILSQIRFLLSFALLLF